MFEYYRLIWGLFDAPERRRFLLLIGLSIGMAIAEMSGVAAIFPFLALAGDPSAMERGAIYPRLSEGTGISDPAHFTAFVGAGVLLLLLSGMGLRALGTYAQTRFAMMRGHSISRRLLRRYLRRPYIWHLEQKGSDLSQSLLSEVDLVVQQAILPAIMLLTNISVSLLIVSLLFLANPMVATVAIGLLAAVYGAVLLILRHPLQRAGTKRVVFNNARFHHVTEVGGAIKELKATGQEQRAVDGFRDPAKGMAEAHTSAIVLGQIPKFALEAVIYGGFVSLLLIAFASHSSALADIMPLLGLFGMASLKLFPALQQVFADISLLRFSRDALERLHEQLHQAPIAEVAKKAGSSSPLKGDIALDGISFRFRGAENDALKNISLSIPVGASVGIVGGTGAGKSTLVDILLGLLPASGGFRVNGHDISADNLAGWQSSIGYVPQHIFLTDDSIAANIAFGVPRAKIDMQAVQQAARMANLHEFIMNDFADGYSGSVGEGGLRLSGGQRQRVGIARALYHDPQVLVLDEATSALDTRTEQRVMQSIEKLNGEKTVIMIAHRLSTVKHCDFIIMLEKGQIIAQGTYDDLIAESAEFRRLAMA